MNRKPIFDAAKALGAKFESAADVAAMDRAIDEAVGQFSGRRISKAALDFIHSFEDCKLTAYPDPGSADGKPWTIGWGTTGPDIKKGVKWTQEQADARFLTDLVEYEDGVTELIGTAPTTQGQFDALVSFAYNVGLGALKTSTLLRMHKEGNLGGAFKQFPRWNLNDGKIMKGLTRRRAAEAAMYKG